MSIFCITRWLPSDFQGASGSCILSKFAKKKKNLFKIETQKETKVRKNKVEVEQIINERMFKIICFILCFWVFDCIKWVWNWFLVSFQEFFFLFCRKSKMEGIEDGPITKSRPSLPKRGMKLLNEHQQMHESHLKRKRSELFITLQQEEKRFQKRYIYFLKRSNCWFNLIWMWLFY